MLQTRPKNKFSTKYYVAKAWTARVDWSSAFGRQSSRPVRFQNDVFAFEYSAFVTVNIPNGLVRLCHLNATYASSRVHDAAGRSNRYFSNANVSKRFKTSRDVLKYWILRLLTIYKLLCRIRTDTGVITERSFRFPMQTSSFSFLIYYRIR